MAFEMEKRAAKRLLSALEEGRTSAQDLFRLIDEADPALVHFVFVWLRAWYPTSHPASEAILGRLGNLMRQYPRVAHIAQEGQNDLVVEWFEEAHEYRDFQADEFIDLVVEKLEG